LFRWSRFLPAMVAGLPLDGVITTLGVLTGDARNWSSAHQPTCFVGHAFYLLW